MTAASGEPGPGRRWRDEPVDRRIRGQGLVVAVIALVVLVLAVSDLAKGTIGPLGAAAAFAFGALVGVFAAARVNSFTWDEGNGRVVARIDRIGLAILVVLVLAHLLRSWVLGHWFQGALLAALGLWLSAGTLAGRLLGTRRGVSAVLRRADAQPPADLPPTAPPPVPDPREGRQP
jgi:hypothetical protein